jgi:hypothetical protein
MTDYIASCKVHLPYYDSGAETFGLENGEPKEGVHKEPGDSITQQELDAAGQTAEDVANMVGGGTLLTQAEWDALQKEDDSAAE